MCSLPETEKSPMRKIAVGLYGQTSDQSLEEKITQIKAFLVQHGGDCQVERKKVTLKEADVLIVFNATIPAWFANRHHSFDSVLNSTTNGFGVAWVEEKP